MIVYNAEPLGYSEKAITLWEGKGYRYVAGDWKLIDQATTIKQVEILIVRLSRKVNAVVLDKFPDLKVLVSATTGLDHIDIPEVERRKLRLCSLRGHDAFLNTIPSTAEHTWALLMALVRNIPAADAHVEKGFWDRDQFRGHQLKGKTLGIIGLGRTGRKVAHYADAFEMKVIYYDPYVDSKCYDRKPELRELLSESDIVSIHVHLDDNTKHLINSTNIKYCRDGVFMINTSRGLIWDEGSLTEALATGKIGGIATDVLESEPDDIKNSRIMKAKVKFKNLIVTPHIAGATIDAMKLCEDYLADLITSDNISHADRKNEQIEPQTDSNGRKTY